LSDETGFATTPTTALKAEGKGSCFTLPLVIRSATAHCVNFLSPCPQGEIVAIINATSTLVCLPDKCGGIIRRQGIEAAAAEQTQLLLLQADNGRCYPFGSSFSNNSSSIFDWVVYVPYSSELGFIIQTQSNSEYPLLSKLNSELTR